MSQINVAVLFGGKSPEHEVSVISANQALNALKGHAKYRITPIYVTKNGDWYTGDRLLDLKNFKDINALLKDCHPLSVSLSERQFFYETKGFFKKKIVLPMDVAFPVFHGKHGEDGCVQGLFELMNLAYVGSNVLASAVTMDKISTKMVLRENGVSVLPFAWFYASEWLLDPEKIIEQLTTEFAFPLIVKPSDLGSSIGISKAKNRLELEQALQTAAQFSTRILVEPAVTAIKEVNCSVMGTNAEAMLSVCEEPVGADEILSFEDKYKNNAKGGQSKGMTSLKRRIPANITPEQEATIREMAASAFKALDSSGLVRIDFILDQNSGGIYVNEVNTIPGSLSFYLWQHSDIDFTQLCERLLQIAVRQHSQKQRLTFSFDANLLSTYTGGKAGKLGGLKGKS